MSKKRYLTNIVRYILSVIRYYFYYLYCIRTHIRRVTKICIIFPLLSTFIIINTKYVVLLVLFFSIIIWCKIDLFKDVDGYEIIKFLNYIGVCIWYMQELIICYYRMTMDQDEILCFPIRVGFCKAYFNKNYFSLKKRMRHNKNIPWSFSDVFFFFWDILK